MSEQFPTGRFEAGALLTREETRTLADRLEAAHNIFGPGICPMCGSCDGMKECPPWYVEHCEEPLYRRGNTLNYPCVDCNPTGEIPAGYEENSNERRTRTPDPACNKLDQALYRSKHKAAYQRNGKS